MNSPLFLRALQNSFVSASLATIITLSIALVLAWCIQRTRIRFKGIVSIVLVLPMLIPTISHGMGLVILFGNNGVLKNLLDLDFQHIRNVGSNCRLCYVCVSSGIPYD